MTPPAGKNRLAFEKSPYLLQHQDNPVDWYAWGDEAFALAAREDKPVFLSIGYSTCHWCHVMEHESFEDDVVAAALNAAFVCIKVDREERPDIDNIYMTVCQMATGSGGWPLTIIMTPDKQPFFAGTYIPREQLLNLVPRVTQMWSEDRTKITETTEQIMSALRQNVAGVPGTGEELGLEAMKSAYDQLSSRFDESRGGFGSSPKFPTPHNFLFLLRYWERTKDVRALTMVEKSLTEMRRGGMYDHVGFGFHRYSTDPDWFLPHFEKMLYDQAMLVMAYTEAFQATGKLEYRRTAEEIVEYVLRDMTDQDGGFYSAEDADSEGEEGKFYLWSENELRAVLGSEADVVMSALGVVEGGNYAEEASGEKSNTNILYLEKPIGESAAALGIGEDELRERLGRARRLLFDVRETRIRPGLDDKILTDWNGLMIAALAKAGRAFERADYVEAAVRAERFISRNMMRGEGGLLHRFRDGDASIVGMIDDYSFYCWGLIELYETTFDVTYLEKALTYTSYATKQFWDNETGGFFFTPDDGENLIVRQKEIYDGAVPSGNSVAMLNLIRLGRITANSKLEEGARRIAAAFEGQITRAASAFTMSMCALDFAVGPSFEIVIAGRRGAGDTNQLMRAIEGRYIPRKVVLLRSDADKKKIAELAPYTKDQEPIDGKATAYVCRNYACELPTNDVGRMLALLDKP